MSTKNQKKAEPHPSLTAKKDWPDYGPGVDCKFIASIPAPPVAMINDRRPRDIAWTHPDFIKPKSSGRKMIDEREILKRTASIFRKTVSQIESKGVDTDPILTAMLAVCIERMIEHNGIGETHAVLSAVVLKMENDSKTGAKH